jgi:hypothetical protein
MKNFKVGKELRTLLSNSGEVTELVGSKVFPIVANEGTTFPFIVYRRTNYTPASNKDYTSEIVGVEINILSQKYDEAVNIADVVATSLDRKETNFIEDIKITNISEDYIEDTFVERIYLDIYIKE